MLLLFIINERKEFVTMDILVIRTILYDSSGVSRIRVILQHCRNKTTMRVTHV